MEECKHTNVYENYLVSGICSMTYLGCNSYEYHCKDCGMFVSNDPCGEESGVSGWSRARWRKFNLKRRNHG